MERQWFRVVNSRDWKAPSQLLMWPSFEAVVLKSVSEWDVMKMAMEGGWCDGDPVKQLIRFIDDLLANFAEKIRGNKAVEIEEIINFLVGEMDDSFNAEVDSSSAFPLAKILLTLYNEFGAGVDTGMKTLLGEGIFQAIVDRRSPFEPVQYQEDDTQDGDESSNSNSVNSNNAITNGPPTPIIDEDGFETVVSKKKKNKPKKQVDDDGDAEMF